MHLGTKTLFPRNYFNNFVRFCIWRHFDIVITSKIYRTPYLPFYTLKSQHWYFLFVANIICPWEVSVSVLRSFSISLHHFLNNFKNHNLKKALPCLSLGHGQTPGARRVQAYAFISIFVSKYLREPRKLPVTITPRCYSRSTVSGATFIEKVGFSAKSSPSSHTRGYKVII